MARWTSCRSMVLSLLSQRTRDVSCRLALLSTDLSPHASPVSINSIEDLRFGNHSSDCFVPAVRSEPRLVLQSGETLLFHLCDLRGAISVSMDRIPRI